MRRAALVVFVALTLARVAMIVLAAALADDPQAVPS